MFTTEEISYCLSEKIRIDASDTVLNKYVASDVAQYNRDVDDYNSRCAAFRYPQGALASAQSNLEPYRAQLEAEGHSRFVQTPSATTKAQASFQDLQREIKVESIQKKLNDLGYDAGPADGFMGSKTRAAMQAFQRDSGFAIDGSSSTDHHR